MADTENTSKNTHDYIHKRPVKANTDYDFSGNHIYNVTSILGPEYIPNASANAPGENEKEFSKDLEIRPGDVTAIDYVSETGTDHPYTASKEAGNLYMYAGQGNLAMGFSPNNMSDPSDFSVGTGNIYISAIRESGNPQTGIHIHPTTQTEIITWDLKNESSTHKSPEEQASIKFTTHGYNNPKTGPATYVTSDLDAFVHNDYSDTGYQYNGKNENSNPQTYTESGDNVTEIEKVDSYLMNQKDAEHANSFSVAGGVYVGKNLYIQGNHIIAVTSKKEPNNTSDYKNTYEDTYHFWDEPLKIQEYASAKSITTGLASHGDNNRFRDHVHTVYENTEHAGEIHQTSNAALGDREDSVTTIGYLNRKTPETPDSFWVTDNHLAQGDSASGDGNEGYTVNNSNSKSLIEIYGETKVENNHQAPVRFLYDYQAGHEWDLYSTYTNASSLSSTSGGDQKDALFKGTSLLRKDNKDYPSEEGETLSSEENPTSSVKYGDSSEGENYPIELNKLGASIQDAGTFLFTGYRPGESGPSKDTLLGNKKKSNNADVAEDKTLDGYNPENTVVFLTKAERASLFQDTENIETGSGIESSTFTIHSDKVTVNNLETKGLTEYTVYKPLDTLKSTTEDDKGTKTSYGHLYQYEPNGDESTGTSQQPDLNFKPRGLVYNLLNQAGGISTENGLNEDLHTAEENSGSKDNKNTTLNTILGQQEYIKVQAGGTDDNDQFVIKAGQLVGIDPDSKKALPYTASSNNNKFPIVGIALSDARKDGYFYALTHGFLPFKNNESNEKWLPGKILYAGTDGSIDINPPKSCANPIPIPIGYVSAKNAIYIDIPNIQLHDAGQTLGKTYASWLDVNDFGINNTAVFKLPRWSTNPKNPEDSQFWYNLESVDSATPTPATPGNRHSIWYHNGEKEDQSNYHPHTSSHWLVDNNTNQSIYNKIVNKVYLTSDPSEDWHTTFTEANGINNNRSASDEADEGSSEYTIALHTNLEVHGENANPGESSERASIVLIDDNSKGVKTSQVPRSQWKNPVEENKSVVAITKNTVPHKIALDDKHQSSLYLPVEEDTMIDQLHKHFVLYVDDGTNNVIRSEQYLSTDRGGLGRGVKNYKGNNGEFSLSAATRERDWNRWLRFNSDASVVENAEIFRDETDYRHVHFTDDIYTENGFQQVISGFPIEEGSHTSKDAESANGYPKEDNSGAGDNDLILKPTRGSDSILKGARPAASSIRLLEFNKYPGAAPGENNPTGIYTSGLYVEDNSNRGQSVLPQSSFYSAVDIKSNDKTSTTTIGLRLRAGGATGEISFAGKRTTSENYKPNNNIALYVQKGNILADEDIYLYNAENNHALYTSKILPGIKTVTTFGADGVSTNTLQVDTNIEIGTRAFDDATATNVSILSDENQKHSTLQLFANKIIPWDKTGEAFDYTKKGNDNDNRINIGADLYLGAAVTSEKKDELVTSGKTVLAEKGSGEVNVRHYGSYTLFTADAPEETAKEKEYVGFTVKWNSDLDALEFERVDE